MYTFTIFKHTLISIQIKFHFKIKSIFESHTFFSFNSCAIRDMVIKKMIENVEPIHNLYILNHIIDGVSFDFSHKHVSEYLHRNANNVYFNSLDVFHKG